MPLEQPEQSHRGHSGAPMVTPAPGQELTELKWKASSQLSSTLSAVAVANKLVICRSPSCHVQLTHLSQHLHADCGQAALIDVIDAHPLRAKTQAGPGLGSLDEMEVATSMKRRRFFAALSPGLFTTLLVVGLAALSGASSVGATVAVAAPATPNIQAPASPVPPATKAPSTPVPPATQVPSTPVPPATKAPATPVPPSNLPPAPVPNPNDPGCCAACQCDKTKTPVPPTIAPTAPPQPDPTTAPTTPPGPNPTAGPTTPPGDNPAQTPAPTTTGTSNNTDGTSNSSGGSNTTSPAVLAAAPAAGVPAVADPAPTSPPEAAAAAPDGGSPTPAPEVAGEAPAPPPVVMPQTLPNTGEPGGSSSYGWWLVAATVLLVSGLVVRSLAPKRIKSR